MQRVILSGAVAALATTAMAGVAADWSDKPKVIEWVDQTWEDKCEGESWPIKWSEGNGHDVALKIKNSTWSHSICEHEKAPGYLDWTVDYCGCEYSLVLEQEDCEAIESPKFFINCAEEEEEHWEDNKPEHEKPEEKPEHWEDNKPEHEKPTNIVVVYVDADCECTKTKETPAPTHGKPVWYDDELKCSVTSTDVKPTETKVWGDNKPAAPVAPAAATTWADAKATTWADNKPVAPTSAAPAPANTWADAPVAPAVATPAKPAAPVADYKGAAVKVGSSAFALAAVFVGALAL